MGSKLEPKPQSETETRWPTLRRHSNPWLNRLTGRPSGDSIFRRSAGIALALGGILGGLILEKGQIQDIVQMTAALIVLGGTIGAVLVTTPLRWFCAGSRDLGSIFFERGDSADATIDALIGYATKARKNGIVSIEKEAAAIEDPFMRKALNLAVDGTDLQEIRKMMDTDISLSEQAARGGSQGLGSGRRIRSHHRDHRRGIGADPGDEASGGYQGSRARHRGGLRGHGIRRGVGQHFVSAGGQ